MVYVIIERFDYDTEVFLGGAYGSLQQAVGGLYKRVQDMVEEENSYGVPEPWHLDDFYWSSNMDYVSGHGWRAEIVSTEMHP